MSWHWGDRLNREGTGGGGREPSNKKVSFHFHVHPQKSNGQRTGKQLGILFAPIKKAIRGVSLACDERWEVTSGGEGVLAGILFFELINQPTTTGTSGALGNGELTR